MTESIMLKKSKVFALRIVRLYKYLRDHKESVIAKQMLRAGTSIGANIAESRYAQSKADFAAKLQIALKEASETEYWLELLRDAELVESGPAFDSICEVPLLSTVLVDNARANAPLRMGARSCERHIRRAQPASRSEVARAVRTGRGRRDHSDDRTGRGRRGRIPRGVAKGTP